MSAEHMLLPRGGYDFIQVSPTEYRWADPSQNRSAVVMAPEGARFGWYYHVQGGSSAGDILGRKPTLDAAFRIAVRSLDAMGQAPRREAGAEIDRAAPLPRRARRLNGVQRFFGDPSIGRMMRMLLLRQANQNS